MTTGATRTDTTGKSRLRRWYDLQAGYGLLSRPRALREQRPLDADPRASVALRVPEFGVEDGVDVAPFLVSTTTGLFYWRDGSFRPLLAGATFGVTLQGGSVLAYQQTGSYGRIVEIRDLDGAPSAATRIWELSKWVHQIDAIGSELVVTDTWRNRLLYYDLASAGPTRAAAAKRVAFVDGDAGAGRESPNYRHINSLVEHRGRLYVMAHNHSLRTGRQSEVYVLDRGHRLVEILPTGGRCCHNVCFVGESMLLCRSLEGTISLDGLEVIKTDGFTRGLAVDRHTVLVGVTSFATDRQGREQDGAAIDVHSRDFTRLGRITLAAGQIRDLRFLAEDLGLSSTATRR